MIKIKNYARPDSLEETYSLLCEKKSNLILGGMLWLKMQGRNVDTAIDLQNLGLDSIEETDTEYHIGSMTSLRELEFHPGLNHLTNNALRDSVKHIVGVQFRNLATIGGSIWGRFGFSDVLTLFMAIDAKVQLYKNGTMTIQEFASFPRTEKDILVKIIVPKSLGKVVYLSQRNISTDFPVLACAIHKQNDTIDCAIGARPKKAKLLQNIPSEPAAAAEYVAEHLDFESNLRGSAEYRKQICKVLVRRGLEQMEV